MNPSILIKLLPLFILISSTTGQEFAIEDEQSTAVPETDLSSSGDPGDVILDPVVDPSVPEIWNIEINKMVDMVRMAMQLLPAAEESIADSLKNSNEKIAKLRNKNAVFNAFTERSTPTNSTIIYSRWNSTGGSTISSPNGIFTVKTAGLYAFMFHAVTNDLKSVLPVTELRVNDVPKATAATYNGRSLRALTLICGAQLIVGDRVFMFVVDSPLFANTTGKRIRNRASFAGLFVN